MPTTIEKPSLTLRKISVNYPSKGPSDPPTVAIQDINKIASSAPRLFDKR